MPNTIAFHAMSASLLAVAGSAAQAQPLNVAVFVEPETGEVDPDLSAAEQAIEGARVALTSALTSLDMAQTTVRAAQGRARVTERRAVTDELPVEKMTKKIAVAKDNGADPVGAFRFLCGPGHLSYNDPLVHPRKKGASHLHQFFGNLSADENSTYESLRKAGDSTCMSALNRSAYWIPALLTGKETVHTPERLVVYYKAEPSTSAFYTRSKTRLSRIPRGLAYIFGWDASRADTKHYTGVSFKCKPKEGPEIKGSMRESLAACSRLGGEFSAGLESPSCWDGTNLTSANNRSHMAYRKREKNTGRLYCPDGYNTALPAFTLRAIYKIDKGSDVSGYEFASDHMVPPAWREPGASFHADWFGAWNDEVLAQWHATCIEAHRNCSDGNLGNGTRMNWIVDYPHDRPIEKRFVRVPAKPATAARPGLHADGAR